MAKANSLCERTSPIPLGPPSLSLPGYQPAARVFQCATCRFVDCQFPLDCPVQDMWAHADEAITLHCDVPFATPPNLPITWMFAKDLHTQDLALFEELQESVEGPLSLTLRDPTPGTIACHLGVLSEPLVRKYFYLNVSEGSVKADQGLQARFRAVLRWPHGRTPLHHIASLGLGLGLALGSMALVLLLIRKKAKKGVGPTHPTHCRGHYKCLYETCRSTALRSSGHYCLDVMGWPKDCSEIPTGSPSGVYIIQPTGLHPIMVYCEMNVTDGGWTVIQRNRQSTEVTWAESWSTYKYGFGNVHTEYWLGTEYIHQISRQKVYQVRFVIWDATDDIKFADYNLFSVEDESHGYRLRLGMYSGTAEDAMDSDNPRNVHNNMKFSTKDWDQDTYRGNCASRSGGGWWYSACYSVQLNVKGAITWGSLCNRNCKASAILIKPAPYH
ncbi:PREDICTED: uncharacterized protein LOC104289887 [Charadrius vociferus]|uniref:uncharacterized protein LOC104289887 n=1 Tax=Charadrius vociferus TaxID=50402 RepID=UPI000521B4B1|nr:PREDICTED: uncharacterized protein LOC104289887 [Charadrius vociferus]